MEQNLRGIRWPDKIDKRWLLLLICGAQLACLLVAGWWYLVRLERDMLTVMRTQVLDSSRKAAGAAASVLESVEPTGPDEAGRVALIDRVRGLIANTQLLDGGAICLLDLKSGQTLYADPNGPSPADASGPADAVSMIESEPVELQPHEQFGWVSDGASKRFVYIRDVPTLGLRIVVDQPKRELRLALGDLLTTVRSAATLVILLVMVCGSALTSSLIHRYEDRLTRLNEDLAGMVEARTESLRKTRDAVIFGLARVAESRDDDTGEHLERIRCYTEILARELSATKPEITPEFAARIGLASSLHDIGKVAIPDAVLLKPGKLDEAERRIIQQHTLAGGDCLLAIKQRLDGDMLLELACQIAYTHHERWDGQGYPFGMSGTEIPLAARIVSLADCYDALTTKRVYKPALTHTAAVDIISAGSGTQYDPDVVQAFMSRQAEFEQVRTSHVRQQPRAGLETMNSKQRATSMGFIAAEHPDLAVNAARNTTDAPDAALRTQNHLQ